MPWTHRGSVKDLVCEIDPTDTSFGSGYMYFKQRDDGTGPFSIFDLKERTPFGIRGKAQAMYDESVYFFELMGKNSIPTHYKGCNKEQRNIYVSIAHMPQKERWEEWVKERGNKPFVVPIELVVSNDITPVASLHKRLRTGKAKPGDYGLIKPPGIYETVTLPGPVITTSTKLDEHDVYRDDLFDIVGLTEEKRNELKQLALQANRIVRKDALQVGLYIADGKFEFIMGSTGKIYTCDTFATSDENRILAETNDGRRVDLSKQFLRNLYTINGYRQEIECAQDAGVPFEEWPVMEPLDENTLRVVERAYFVVQQELCRKPMGLDLQIVATEVQDMLDRFKEKYRRDETGESL